MDSNSLPRRVWLGKACSLLLAAAASSDLAFGAGKTAQAAVPFFHSGWSHCSR